jgi:GNAT superfamily N-acetyltransferase
MEGTGVRPFAEDDFDAWYPLWRAYGAFYRVDIPFATSEVTWRRLLDPSEPMWGTFAVADHQPIGFVHAIRHRSCWSVADSIYLQDLFVDPAHRGRGAGRRLIDHVYAEAARLGCARVHWLTHESNADAMLLYDRIAQRSGFVQYRRDL